VATPRVLSDRELKLAKADAAALAEEGERLARFIAPAAKTHRVTFA
jgi:hypothetical protein